ncbi:MAG TPA: enolase C-terminal domain-like protein, partial [Candidatus Limnocylindrales bacterium]
IDQALHDITAKDLGVPIYRLLGGPVRDRVRMYDHLGGGRTRSVYEEESPEALAELAAQCVADGYDAIKVLPVGRTAAIDGAATVRRAERLMRAVREAVGEDVDVMIDLHGRTTSTAAIEYGRALAPYRPWFIEEPVQPGNVAAMAEVARALPIPIAAGERLVSRQEFGALFEARAVAVAQPDVCHAGGLSEVRRIAALAESYGVSMAPHNPLGPIATMASIQLAVALPNFLIQEALRSDVPWRYDVVSGCLPVKGGRVGLPTGPGIGIEVDEAEAARHPWAPEPLLRWFHDDGSVADW